MRHDHHESAADAAQRSYRAAADDLAAAERELAAATQRVAAAEARQQRCSTRVQRLRHLAARLAQRVQSWWRLAASATAQLTSLPAYDTTHAEAAAAKRDLDHAERRVHLAQQRSERLRQRRAVLYAQQHGWQGLATSATAMLTANHAVETLQADEQHCYTAIASSTQRRDRSAHTVTAARVALRQNEEDQRTARHEVQRLRSIQHGMTAEGLSAYLARASPADRATIQALNAQAQDDGRRSRGRRPASADDPRAAAKAKRAAAARERRARQRAAGTGNRNNDQKAQHREDRRARRQAARTASVVGPPQRRFHMERMMTMEPDERIAYHRFVDWSRRRGHAAAIADAEARQRANCPHPYAPPHLAVPLGEGSRLIAVRGLDPAQSVHVWADDFQTDPALLERWLDAPVRERIAHKGGRNRLRHGALHIVAAWAPRLLNAARAGDLDAALAREVDLLIARFDLTGHRLAAILHTDATGGHPHLHIVASRVRAADLSLWSLPGRERAVALWLHARSNTVTTCGTEALDDDIDALAGRSPAAKAGEALLAHGQLAALRTHVEGQQDPIHLQGQAAAARVAAVGRSAHEIAGGLWLFGLGADPSQDAAWRRAVDEGGLGLDQQQPHKRGYWLGIGTDDERRRYAKYLARLSVG